VARLRFIKEQHVRKGTDFKRVFERRCVGRTKFLTVFGAPNTEGQLRLGLSVSKKNGNAIRRNRIKRLLREAFRLSRPKLPAGLDLVLVPVLIVGDAPRPSLEDFRTCLMQGARTVARKLERELNATAQTAQSEKDP